MARVEKNAKGESVRVDTEEFGCRTIERSSKGSPTVAASSASAASISTTKAKSGADTASGSDKGDE